MFKDNMDNNVDLPHPEGPVIPNILFFSNKENLKCFYCGFTKTDYNKTL